MLINKLKKIIIAFCFIHIVCFPALTRAEKFSFFQQPGRRSILITNRIGKVISNSKKIKELIFKNKTKNNFNVLSVKDGDENIFDHLINKLSKTYGTDPALIKAMVHVESSFNPKARSKFGAMGLMQLMPSTAREMGVKNPFEAEDNLRGGIKYISKLLNKFKGKIDLSLAAYNAGPSKVRKYRGIPPYRETKKYVSKVMNLHKHYRFNM